MTPKQFYYWQTAGGTDEVTRLVKVHPHLWKELPQKLQTQIQKPA